MTFLLMILYKQISYNNLKQLKLMYLLNKISHSL